MGNARSLRTSGEQPIDPGIRRHRGPVARRRVVYCCGYDPRPPEGAVYGLLEREAERYCKERPLSFELSPLVHAADGETSSWTLTLEGELNGEAWRTQADYIQLRWDDIVAEDFARWFPERAARSFATFFDYLFSGAMLAMARTFHRTLILWLYPVFAIAGIILLAGFGAWSAWELLPLSAPLRIVAALACFLAVIAGGAWFTRFTFIQHLADLWTFCRDFAVGKRPDMEARCEAFAGYVLDAVRKDDVDETLLIGHSYGTMMIVEATARALKRDAEAFRKGAPITLITLGSCLNTSTLHPAAEARREAVRIIAENRDLLWIEIQGRQDMINYFEDDPGVAAGLADDDARANPVVRWLSLRDTLAADTYARFSMNYFRMHFQTIFANDQPHPWDYFLTVAGPDPVAERVKRNFWEYRWEETDIFMRQSVPLVLAFPDLPETPSRERKRGKRKDASAT
ncbi:hypothetical protein ACKTEK_02340 [Tepidamorphus sp. 3E244]|uniref:hypothetical protein n=1 Tax=Tepidamorphus sp. 3E244 TaxID=3385498 RepID=UPI0038FBE76F